LLTSIMLICIAFTATAQHSFKAIIKGGEEKQVLEGATVVWKEQNKSAIADSTGLAIITGITDGKQTFIISYVGFEEKTLEYTFPLASEVPIIIELEEDEHHHEAEVVVTATRISRTIAN